MAKVYVIYEVREEDYVALNNLQVNFDCVKVFNSFEKAKNYVDCELIMQCDVIKLNGKITYDNTNGDEEDLWVGSIEEKENATEINLYYNDEWQSTMYLKEMEVE